MLGHVLEDAPRVGLQNTPDLHLHIVDIAYQIPRPTRNFAQEARPELDLHALAVLCPG